MAVLPAAQVDHGTDGASEWGTRVISDANRRDPFQPPDSGDCLGTAPRQADGHNDVRGLPVLRPKVLARSIEKALRPARRQAIAALRAAMALAPIPTSATIPELRSGRLSSEAETATWLSARAAGCA